jgi:hypothetical protein
LESIIELPVLKIYRFCIGLIFIVLGIQAKAQDTLIMIDRAPMVVSSVEVDLAQVYYTKQGKKKQKSMEIYKVYSIKRANKEEQFIYVQDTLEGNWYTREQMADYIAGQADARAMYKTKAARAGAGGVMIGFLGSGTGLVYGPFFVIGYTVLKGYSKPSLKKENGFNEAFFGNPYYTEGFGTMAKRYTVRRSAAGAAAGYILGAITLSIVL